MELIIKVRGDSELDLLEGLGDAVALIGAGHRSLAPEDDPLGQIEFEVIEHEQPRA